MNLYDVAGNLWEWTTETSYIKDITYAGNINYNSYIIRGGGFAGVYATIPACYRAHTFTASTYTTSGFRPALFIQQNEYRYKIIKNDRLTKSKIQNLIGFIKQKTKYYFE